MGACRLIGACSKALCTSSASSQALRACALYKLSSALRPGYAWLWRCYIPSSNEEWAETARPRYIVGALCQSRAHCSGAAQRRDGL